MLVEAVIIAPVKLQSVSRLFWLIVAYFLWIFVHLHYDMELGFISKNYILLITESKYSPIGARNGW